MIVKIKDKEYSFDGYAQPLQSIQQLAEECYEQGRAEAIDECIRVIEESKSLYDNSTKWTMGEKDKLQNRLMKLKERTE